MALNANTAKAAHWAGIVVAFIGAALVTYSLLTAPRAPAANSVVGATAAAASCKKTVTTVLAQQDGTSKTIQEELRVDCTTGLAPAAGDTATAAGARVAGKVLLHMLF